MMMTTPQQLGRTANAHHHDDLEVFCLECITSDLFLDDFRADLALLTCIRLRHLAEHRAAEIGATWADVWNKVLDLGQLQADLSSSDPQRSALAYRAQTTVEAFLTYRKAVAQGEHVTAELALAAALIEQATHAQLDELERTEPESFGHSLN
jgi:hypothetical protein